MSHPADIRAAVEKRGSTLKAVSLAAGLNPHACRLALRQRHIGGEQALAEFLGQPVWKLWPDRWRVRNGAVVRIDYRTKELRSRRNPKDVAADLSCQKSRAA